MSPVKPENRMRYPGNWRQISERIRFDRAMGRCECTGQCGRHRDVRCEELHLRLAKHANGRIILTVAHLDHTPENCADENLLAMCQRCHLRYDRDHHAFTRTGQRALFSRDSS